MLHIILVFLKINNSSYFHTRYHLVLCFINIYPSVAHVRFSLENVSQSIVLDLAGIFEHHLVLESLVICSLHFSPALLWLFPLSSLLPVPILLVFLKALPGLFLLSLRTIPG